IHAFFSWMSMRCVSRSSVGWSFASSASGSTLRAVRGTASWASIRSCTIFPAFGTPKAGKMVQLLLDAQEAVTRTARSVLPLAEEANDQPTLDLLTQRMDIHEKNAWM